MARSSKAVGRVRASGPRTPRGVLLHALTRRRCNQPRRSCQRAGGSHGVRKSPSASGAPSHPKTLRQAKEGDSRSSAGAARADPGGTGLAQKRAFGRRRRRSPTAFARSDVAGSGRRSRWPHLPQVRHGRASGEGFGHSRALHEHEAQSVRRSQELIDRPAPRARANITGLLRGDCSAPLVFLSRRNPTGAARPDLVADR